MRRGFIEATLCSRRADAAGDEIRRMIEHEIMRDPAGGAVMPGTGGFRKLRVADPRRGKGKRGGYRVIYIDMPLRGWTYLLMLFDKDEQADLSAEQRRELRRVAEEFKKEDIR